MCLQIYNHVSLVNERGAWCLLLYGKLKNLCIITLQVYYFVYTVQNMIWPLHYLCSSLCLKVVCVTYNNPTRWYAYANLQTSTPYISCVNSTVKCTWLVSQCITLHCMHVVYTYRSFKLSTLPTASLPHLGVQGECMPSWSSAGECIHALIQQFNSTKHEACKHL